MSPHLESFALGPVIVHVFGLCALVGWLLALGTAIVVAHRRKARLSVPALVLGVGFLPVAVGNVLLQRLVYASWPAEALVAPTLLFLGALLAWLLDRKAVGTQLDALVAGGLLGCVPYALGSLLVQDDYSEGAPLQMVGCALLAAVVLGMGARGAWARGGLGAAVGLVGYGLMQLAWVPLSW